MPTEIDRHRAEEMIDHGAQVLDVLEAEEFAASHLPGAVNIALSDIPDVAPRVLDPARPVVVYCYDSSCDLSPRAAYRLEALGFADVYDFVGSKMEWIDAGLPFEGANTKLPLLVTLADDSVPTCGIDDAVRSVRFDGWDVCVVCDGGGVVLGVLDADAARSDDGRTALEAMREAPRTYRPHVHPKELVPTVEDERRPVLVTRPEGTLIGAIPPDEVLAAARS